MLPDAADAAQAAVAPDERAASPTPLIVAIVGAESTGKSTLAQALAGRVVQACGLSATWVSEALRDWCSQAGRTPRIDEQAGIARAQQARIDAAAARFDVVVCDTTPLMTAVYSRLIFGDDSLDAMALACQQRCDLTLLTALDLPWVPDGLQRDGPQVRAPVDALVRRLLAQCGAPWSLVAGLGDTRVDAALDALAPLLRTRAPSGSGLFTRLAERNAGPQGSPWICTECDVPACEHAAFKALKARQGR